MGANDELLYRAVHFPIVIPDFLAAGFFYPIRSGFQINTGCAILTGYQRIYLFAAGFIFENCNVPAGDFVAGIGRFHKASQAGFQVVPCVHCGFSNLHSRGMEPELHGPVRIICGRLGYQVFTGSQIWNDNDTRFICGKRRSGNFCTGRGLDREPPSVQMIACIGGLADFQCALQRVGKGNRRCLTSSHRNRFHAGITDPIAIIRRQFHGV